MVTRNPRPGKRNCLWVVTATLRLVLNLLPLYTPSILNHICVQSYYHIIHLWSHACMLAFTPMAISSTFGYRISPAGNFKKRRHNQSLPISLLWHMIYSLAYQMVLEWRPVYPIYETLLARGSQKLVAIRFPKRS